MLNKKRITEVIGWYGVFAILLAYALVSFKIVPTSSYLYQLLNLTGAISIAVISITKKAKQPATLNVVWAIIAFVAIICLIING